MTLRSGWCLSSIDSLAAGSWLRGQPTLKLVAVASAHEELRSTLDNDSLVHRKHGFRTENAPSVRLFCAGDTTRIIPGIWTAQRDDEILTNSILGELLSALDLDDQPQAYPMTRIWHTVHFP